MTLQQLLLGGGFVLLSSLALMMAVIAGSVVAADRYLARAGASQAQLTLVTRLEADANALLLNGDAGDTDAHVAAYLASIDSEQRIFGAGEDQAKERRLAAMLARSFAAVRNGGDPRDLIRLRQLVELVGARERAEVAAVTDDINVLRTRAIGAAMIVATLLCAIFAAIGWALWRAVARPLQALGAGTTALAQGSSPARVIPRGIAELRIFAARFN